MALIFFFTYLRSKSKLYIYYIVLNSRHFPFFRESNACMILKINTLSGFLNFLKKEPEENLPKEIRKFSIKSYVFSFLPQETEHYLESSDILVNWDGGRGR